MKNVNNCKISTEGKQMTICEKNANVISAEKAAVLPFFAL